MNGNQKCITQERKKQRQCDSLESVNVTKYQQNLGGKIKKRIFMRTNTTYVRIKIYFKISIRFYSHLLFPKKKQTMQGIMFIKCNSSNKVRKDSKERMYDPFEENTSDYCQLFQKVPRSDQVRETVSSKYLRPVSIERIKKQLQEEK